MKYPKFKSTDTIEQISIKATRWIGSTTSLLVHTVLFILSFTLYFYGIEIGDILLVLTTIVSLEAIYLSIFIQMSVNYQSRRLHAVARDVDEIQKDVDEIQKDVDEIQEDVEDIQEEEQNELNEQKKDDELLLKIEESLGKLIEEVMELKKQNIIKKGNKK